MEMHSPPNPSPQEDAQVLYEDCCSSDPAVVEAGFQRLGTTLLRFARLQLHGHPNSEQIAYDCTQQALFTIWQKITTGNGPTRVASFISWSVSIVVHKVLDELRRRKRDRTFSLDEELEHGDSSIAQLPDPTVVSPEIYTVDQDVKAELVRLIQQHRQLSAEVKIVLLYGFLLDWTDEELANYLDKKRVTIRVLRSRGLSTLRQDEAFMHMLSFLVSFEVSQEDDTSEDESPEDRASAKGMRTGRDDRNDDAGEEDQDGTMRHR